MSEVQFNNLPDEALLREKQLVKQVVPFSSTTLWRRVRAGTFPEPRRLGPGITAWRWGEVRAWLEAQGRQEAA